MSNHITQSQDRIIGEFSHLNDWFETYEYLINLGKQLNFEDDNLKTEEHIIGGCQSQVWISAIVEKGKMNYKADSDSLLIKGIISLLLQVLNDQKPVDVIDSDLYFVERIGLKSHLSPTKANGVLSIINQMKSYAEKSIKKN